MIPTRIELENFLSFGSPPVEFCFTDDEPLWVLCGQNGTGKSAVFDGITYALYGVHRDGPQKAERLIRHGANGFRVVFEFKFGDAEFRITRTRTKNTTQKVERRIDDEWVAEPGVDQVREIGAWVEKLLGLNYESFTSSVLLLQGEAEKLFDAGRGERIKVLKRIIGFERIEDVSKRIQEATKQRKNKLESLKQQIDHTEHVTPEELAAAEETLALAEQNRHEAQQAHAATVQRIEQAKQFQSLIGKQAELQRKLKDADARAHDADAIRAAKQRLDDLSLAVPILRTLLDLHDKTAGATPKLAAETAKRDQTTAAIQNAATAHDQARLQAEQHRQRASDFDHQAKTLASAIGQDRHLLETADAMEKLAASLAKYPADLAQQLERAENAEKIASDELQAAKDELKDAELRLQHAQEQLHRFNDVKVGATCSQCGQFVDEHHAAKERTRLANELRAYNAEIDRRRTQFSAFRAKHAATQKSRAALQKDKIDFDKLTAQAAILKPAGDLPNAADLRTRLANQEQQKTNLEKQAKAAQTAAMQLRTEADRLDAGRKKLDGALTASAATIRQLETDLTTWRAHLQSKRDQLAADWQARLDDLGRANVDALAAERDQLLASDIKSRFEALLNDERLRTEWTQQLTDLGLDIERIPADARIADKDARQQESEARTRAERATSARDEAVRQRDHARSTLELLDRLRTELRTAERAYDLHKKLDELLGQNGLQRELVRDAEQQIVALANETLQNLSDGDLALEPDDDAAGRDDKAFALRVRVAGLTAPVTVAFLSGSQKFRVAVSVALAIGRFASGRARPLEAVIIDEGFGSLDQDGLRAMADELKRLQQTQSLKRVILVSHQEAFTSRFPVGYQLEASETGTTAKPFRR